MRTVRGYDSVASIPYIIANRYRPAKAGPGGRFACPCGPKYWTKSGIVEGVRFEELDIPPRVLDGIRAAGFTECTPVQALTLPEALRGKDIAAQAQTGTGKTAAFLIAVFSRMIRVRPPGRGPSPRALIIAPTRELVLQINAEARLLGGPAGFRILPVFGGIDYVRQRDEISKGVDVLIGTPGRLIDYLKQKVYSLRKTQFLVIDEADRLFDMGFISDLRFLLRRLSPYNRRQSMLFSATLSNRVLELCYEHMNNPIQFSVTPEKVTVEQVEQEIYHVGTSEKVGALLGILRRAPGGRYLIFCNTKAAAERLEAVLNANGLAAAAITGDLPQIKRLKVLSRFRDGTLPILVATDVASRGLHIEGVTHVINYDLPQDIKQKIPVMPVTDEMIVRGYRKGGRLRRTAAQPQRKESREARRQERPRRRDKTFRKPSKTGPR
jgi:ATP-dependent RNA helicase RhlB